MTRDILSLTAAADTNLERNLFICCALIGQKEAGTDLDLFPPVSSHHISSSSLFFFIFFLCLLSVPLFLFPVVCYCVFSCRSPSFCPVSVFSFLLSCFFHAPFFLALFPSLPFFFLLSSSLYFLQFYLFFLLCLLTSLFLLSFSFIVSVFISSSLFLCVVLLLRPFCRSTSEGERDTESASSIIQPHSADSRHADRKETLMYRNINNPNQTESCEYFHIFSQTKKENK